MAETQLIQARMPDGKTIAMQVTAISGPVQYETRVGTNLPHNFSEVMDSLESISRTIYDVVQKVAPKKASVEFGIEIAAEPGKLTALLVQGEGKASLKIKLEWH
jgi:hypothetical protein